MLLYGPYTLEPGWDATIRRCTFENLTYCIFANGFEEHGTLLIENNTAFGSASGLVLFWVGSSTTVRYNTWNMPMTATGVHIQLRGDGIPKVHDETILGGWYGMIVGGQHQRFEIRNITIEDVISVGLMCYLVDLDIYDSYIKTLGHNFQLSGPTFIHIHDCDTGHSGVVQGTGEILELTEINITSVTWQEGTPIEEGIVVFETEEGFQLALRNNSAPSPLEFPMWVVREHFYLFVDEARGTHRQGDAVFYSDLFPLKGVESMALVIYDRLAPLLGVDNLTDGAKVREDSLLVGGTVVERGAGMGSVRVRCSGRDWEAASLSGDGTWRLTLTNLADGVVSVSVNATDRAGNSVQLEVRNITVDTVVPPIEVLGPPSHVRTTPAELLVRTEPGSTAHVNFRPVEVSEWGRFSTIIPLYEGENGVLIVVEDFAGNRNETTYMVYLDTRAPILLVSSPEEGEWTRGEPVWVNGTTEVGASVTVNGEPVEPDHGAFSFPLSLEEGEVLLVITAVDLAGNVASVTRTVRVDRTPPTLEALEPGNGHVTNQRVLVVVGNATDASPVVVMVQGHPVAMVGPKWFKELLL
ncbi:MAG: hypothetical protein KAQ96_01085, partial [Thermoplasmata archaeon]|nr:hypothetical protein [Thermoplasmata archaeon]